MRHEALPQGGARPAPPAAGLPDLRPVGIPRTPTTTASSYHQPAAGSLVLVLNSGSSSVKFALLLPESGERVMDGIGERLGTPEALLRVQWFAAAAVEERVPEGTHRAVMARVLDHLAEAGHGDAELLGAGHRVVHGGERFTASIRVDDTVIVTLRSFDHLAPLHNPANLAGIEAVRAVLPDLPQVAVFDTAFHQTMPPHAFRYAVPEEWYLRHGVRRYGFHGTSHRFVSEQAASMLGRPPRELRLVTAHLGNGCSATAVRDGVSVDTTMGLTPLEGLVMGTRSGDVDPGLLGYLAGRTGMNVDELTRALNVDSGLQGLSGVGNDMRTVAAPPLTETSGRGSPSTFSCTGCPRRSPGWWSGFNGSTHWSSPAASGKTAPSSVAWCSAGWASSAWLRTLTPMPTTAGTPEGVSASPARSWRWSYRRTRSS